MKKIKENIYKISIFIGLLLFFYIFRVWKTHSFTGEWHYNLFAYMGKEKVLIAVVFVAIAIIIGKLKI